MLDAAPEGATQRVGMQKVAMQVMLTYRLLRRFCARLGFSAKYSAYVGVRVSGIKHAVLAKECRQDLTALAACLDEVVELRHPASLESLEEDPMAIVSSLLADFSWDMERTDLVAEDWSQLILDVEAHLDRECRFPAAESIAPWFDMQTRD